ncbi:hypothetical protein [Bifidobacterium saguinibicoloris]|uniref:hypothetical protein n=1 Tax=Bifidobacterium saguinibicoloris TaxID=2834433 RepID=UPI001C596325|nr:hypothetical protein [Bifidobacterium saguinibicoloris]MBW3081591.1 hypothetical protein [Bifidobacterium saguinibicoloris]
MLDVLGTVVHWVLIVAAVAAVGFVILMVWEFFDLKKHPEKEKAIEEQRAAKRQRRQAERERERAGREQERERQRRLRAQAKQATHQSGQGAQAQGVDGIDDVFPRGGWLTAYDVCVPNDGHPLGQLIRRTHTDELTGRQTSQALDWRGTVYGRTTSMTGVSPVTGQYTWADFMQVYAYHSEVNGRWYRLRKPYEFTISVRFKGDSRYKDVQLESPWRYKSMSREKFDAEHRDMMEANTLFDGMRV